MALSPNGMVWSKGESVAVLSTVGLHTNGITFEDASARAHGTISEKQECPVLALLEPYTYLTRIILISYAEYLFY